MAEQNSEVRADPAFKIITSRLAQEAGLKLVGAELAQSLTADMVLEIPPDNAARLESSLFSFLKGYQFAVVEFKVQNDQFTLHKFLTNLARTTLFCMKHEEVAVAEILNLYVCSKYPDTILAMANPTAETALFTNTPEQPWLWRCDLFFQQIIIVVCRDLPIEPPFYDWLVFAPASTRKWRDFVKVMIRQGRRDIIEMVKKLRPKEFGEMSINVNEILGQLDPQEQARIEADSVDAAKMLFSWLAEKKPEKISELIKNLGVEKFVSLLSAEERTEISRLLTNKQQTEGDN